jgi:dihydrofolate reductase
MAGALLPSADGRTIAAELAETDALLLGRRTYEEFAGFWPQATGDPMNAIPKLVASTTLNTVGWQNTACWGRTRPPSCAGGSTTGRS